MSGKLNTYGAGGPGPFRFGGGGDRTKSGSRRSTRAIYPASVLSGEMTLLLLLVWLYYLVFLLSRESVVFSGLRMNRSELSEPRLRCAWASFYTLKGSPTGGNAEEGINVKSEVVGTVACIVHPT